MLNGGYFKNDNVFYLQMTHVYKWCLQNYVFIFIHFSEKQN